MNPTREQCKQALAILNGKRGVPRPEVDGDKTRLRYVLDALVDTARSAEHLQRIVERLEQADDYPSGYHVRQAASDTRKPDEESKPAGTCENCHGYGVIHYPRHPETGEVNSHGWAKRCGCWSQRG